jgi:hypothetical protein
MEPAIFSASINVLLLYIPVIEIAHNMSEALKNTLSTKIVSDVKGSISTSCYQQVQEA